MIQHLYLIVSVIVVIVTMVIAMVCGIHMNPLSLFRDTTDDASKSTTSTTSKTKSTKRVRFAPTKHIREFIISTREWKGAERTMVI